MIFWHLWLYSDESYCPASYSMCSCKCALEHLQPITQCPFRMHEANSFLSPLCSISPQKRDFPQNQLWKRQRSNQFSTIKIELKELFCLKGIANNSTLLLLKDLFWKPFSWEWICQASIIQNWWYRKLVLENHMTICIAGFFFGRDPPPG